MATPAELVRTIARVTGLPETTVINHDRNLAKAGFRTVGGRGTGSAQMTVRDASNLLISVAGTSTVKNSLVPVKKHAKLQLEQPLMGRWEIPFAPIHELQELPDNHTFQDAIEAMIKSAANGSLLQIIHTEKTSTFNDEGYTGYPEIDVHVYERPTWAEIDISVTWLHDDGAMIVEPREVKYYNVLDGVVCREDRETGDMALVRQFSHHTLLMLGYLLSGRNMDSKVPQPK